MQEKIRSQKRQIEQISQGRHQNLYQASSSKIGLQRLRSSPKVELINEKIAPHPKNLWKFQSKIIISANFSQNSFLTQYVSGIYKRGDANI